MKWELSEIKVGDAVRVNMGAYYHYGICTAEDRIVQFGLPVINLNPEEVKVLATDIKTFLHGKFAEILVLDKKELKKSNKIETIISKAESSIGQNGYNILHNNCEHFVNRCVFNEDTSKQVTDVQNKMKELLTVKEVYIAPTSLFVNNTVIPLYIKKELKKITNLKLRDQKLAAYGLLKYAVEQSFGIKEDFKGLKKLKNGKPISENYKFSISHTQDIIAVAVSKCEVGVDVEEIDANKNAEWLINSMLSESETIEKIDIETAIKIWTKKEAIFKFKNIKTFNPKNININEVKTKSEDFEHNGKFYILSLATTDIANVKIINLLN